MKILKKNQIVIIVIAVMLITAGYLNYEAGDGQNLIATGSLMNSEEVAEIGDAKLVSSNNISEEKDKNANNEETESNSNESSKQTSELVENEDENSSTVGDKTDTKNAENSKTSNTTKETSVAVENTDSYFSASRLGRDTMYSQMIESYEKILENQSISNEQKAIAQTEIKKINDLKNSIMITENLIKTKGFSDVVIFVNDASVNAIIKADTLKQEDTAQIQNIITRELKVDIDNVHISNK